MAETEKQKHDRRRQEATVYRVEEDFGKRSGIYRLSKRTLDVELDVYHVTYKPATGDDEAHIWCDCPGFKRQKFAHDRHKHVRAVKDFIKRGSPKHAEYRFIGAGKNTKIKFVRKVDE